MDNIHLRTRVDNTKYEIYSIINDLIFEIEELEIKNKSLELQLDHLQDQLNDLK